jgi:hypothetical protein
MIRHLALPAAVTIALALFGCDGPRSASEPADHELPSSGDTVTLLAGAMTRVVAPGGGQIMLAAPTDGHNLGTGIIIDNPPAARIDLRYVDSGQLQTFEIRDRDGHHVQCSWAFAADGTLESYTVFAPAGPGPRRGTTYILAADGSATGQHPVVLQSP